MKTDPQSWPVPLTTFVGRAVERAALAKVVAASGLVTILGPPGIGKTRLALEWRRDAGADDFPGGIRFCDLADASTADDVVRLAAKALGVALGATEKSVAHLTSTLAAWERSVLVLDNFEHVVDVAHDLVTALRSGAPHAHLLVTSRERLKLEGEVVFDLGPLGDAAVSLFVARAAEARAGYTLGVEDEAVVAELVRELDENPLAIELAAARTRVMSPKEILARMPSRFEVLVTERRGQPRRSALLDAIEGSFRLLPEWGQRALAACSTFRGGFDLVAAEHVIDLSRSSGESAPPIVDVLEMLTDKSLVAVRKSDAGELRFVLHASIRAFAASRLDAVETDAVRSRHAGYYADASRAWARMLLGADAPRGLEALRREAENMGAALRWIVERDGPVDDALVLATTLASLFGADGPFGLRASFLEDAIAAADRAGGADPALLVEALDASVLALVAIGRPEESRANAERAVRLAADLSPSLRGRVGSTLALSVAMAGNADDAVRTLDEAVATIAAANDPLHEGRVRGRRAWLAWMMGDLEGARAHFDAALALHRASGDRTFEAMNGGYLAIVLHELGEVGDPSSHDGDRRPRRLLEHAIAEERALGHRRVEADLLSALGSLAHEEGDLEEALALQRQALATYRELGHARDQASLLADIGHGAIDVGDLAAARDAYAEALPVARATSNAFTVTYAEAGLGVVAARAGRLDEARACFDRAAAAAPPGPRGQELVELVRGHLDLAESKVAADPGPCVAAAQARLARVTSHGPVRYRERRLAAATLARAIEDAILSGRRPSHPPPGQERVLSLASAKRTVTTPDGTVIELERHPALWRLVEAFADAHARAPGRPIAVGELLARGWPDERVRADAGARRVYTALSTLRQRGLRGLLVKSADGYAFPASVKLVFADTPQT